MSNHRTLRKEFKCDGKTNTILFFMQAQPEAPRLCLTWYTIVNCTLYTWSSNGMGHDFIHKVYNYN